MKKIFLLFVALVCFGLTMNAQEKIFYVANSSTNYVTIFSKNTDGSGKVQIFNDTWHRTGVNVTSDGFLYYLKRERPVGISNGKISLCKSNIDGSNETELWIYPNSATLDLRGYINLRSDKKKVLYSTIEGVNRDGDVFELDLTSFNSVNISQNNDYCPSGTALYSKDLSKIIFIELATTWYAHPWYMYLINSDGTNKIKITPNGNQGYYAPSFSNDGTKMVYCSYVNLGEALQLYIANSDGTNGQQVVLSSGASDGINYPVFNPDDTKLIFYRNNNLVIAKTDGTILTEFANEPITDQLNIVWAKIITQSPSTIPSVPVSYWSILIAFTLISSLAIYRVRKLKVNAN